MWRSEGAIGSMVILGTVGGITGLVTLFSGPPPLSEFGVIGLWAFFGLAINAAVSRWR